MGLGTNQDTTNTNLKNIYEGSPDLKAHVIDRYKKMFEKMLDLVEDFVLVSDTNGQQIFQNIRSKILRQGNDATREMDEVFAQFTIKEKIRINDKIDFGALRDQETPGQDKEEDNGQGKH